MYDETSKDDADLFDLALLRDRLSRPSTTPLPVLLARRDNVYNWATMGGFDSNEEPTITDFDGVVCGGCGHSTWSKTKGETHYSSRYGRLEVCGEYA